MNVQNVMEKGAVIDGSPVSFALMGPRGNHRGVIVRSDDRSLDLIGLDDRVILDWTETGHDFSRSAGIFRKTLLLTPHIVRSDPRYVIESPDDNRHSHLSFAWKGLASPADEQYIMRAFSQMAPDIYSAAKVKDVTALEWQIAPLISLCQRTTEKLEAKHERRRALLFTAGTVYAMIVLAAIVQYMVSRYIF